MHPNIESIFDLSGKALALGFCVTLADFESKGEKA